MNRLFIVLLVFIFSTISTSAFAEKTFTYVVKKGGETCDKIAKRVYGDVYRIDLLHKYNDLDELCWLGKKQKLPEGMKLKLPDPPPAGTITGSKGKVNSKPPTLKWKKAQIGQDLFRSWQVNTFEKSKAEVTFRDSSRIKMRENTLIVIYGATKRKARSRPTRARLEKGTLRTAFESNAGGGMVVETPSSESEVKSKSSLVSVEKDGTTRVANHGEGKINVRSAKKKKSKKRKRKKVVVKKGMGTKIEKGKEPEPPRKLPPRPSWKKSPNAFLSIDEKPISIFAEWDALPSAEEYYVEIAKDNRGIDVIQSVVVPKNITRLEVKNLPAGDYFASVSTIDNDQFESLPLGPRKISVRDGRSKGKVIETEPYKVYIGTSFLLPREIKCGKDEMKSAIIRVNDIGNQVYLCVDNKGGEIDSFEVIGVAPSLKIEGDSFSENTLVLPPKGAFINLVFDPVRPQSIQVSSENEEIKIGNPIPVGEDTYRIRVYGKDAGKILVKSGDVELGSFEVSPVQGPVGGKLTWSFGVGVEAFHNLEDPRFRTGGHWGMLELMGGVSPNQNLSLELTLGLGAFDLDDYGIKGAGDLRLRGLFGVNFGDFNPFFQMSAGIQGSAELEKIIPVLGLGAGFNYWLDEGSGLRLDGAIGISEGAQSEQAFFPEVRLKYIMRWN